MTTTATATYLTRSTEEPCWLIVTRSEDDISSEAITAPYDDEARALGQTDSLGYVATWTPGAPGGYWSDERGEYGRYDLTR